MKMYYCNSNNFGDALNKYIFQNVFNVKAEYSDSWNCDSAGIGSIIERFFIQTNDIFRIKFQNILKPVAVLSSGLSQPEEYYLRKARFFKTMKFKRKMTLLSLRWKITQKAIENVINAKLNDIVLGDLGLLVPRLIVPSKFKKYDIGICPHYSEKNNPIFEKIYSNNLRCITIDTQMDPIDFLNKISECKCVISTGLHPLIAADALGIPNLWCRISEKNTPKNKFYDYYSVYNIKPEPFYINSGNISADNIIENYSINIDDVVQIQEVLYSRHKDFLKNLNNV